MKSIRFALVLAAMFGLFAFADNSFASNAPGGSYRKSCKNIRVHDNGMTAVCKTRDGRWVKTSLPARDMACPNGIENMNGRLVCPRG